MQHFVWRLLLQTHDLRTYRIWVACTQSFVHVSQEWHGSANNDEYVSPEKYGEVMLDTVFSICPKVSGNLWSGRNTAVYGMRDHISTLPLPLLMEFTFPCDCETILDSTQCSAVPVCVYCPLFGREGVPRPRYRPCIDKTTTAA